MKVKNINKYLDHEPKVSELDEFVKDELGHDTDRLFDLCYALIPILVQKGVLTLKDVGHMLHTYPPEECAPELVSKEEEVAD